MSTFIAAWVSRSGRYTGTLTRLNPGLTGTCMLVVTDTTDGSTATFYGTARQTRQHWRHNYRGL